MLRIGIISTLWLPVHGGAQQYTHRLALALAQINHFHVFAFCATQEDPGKDNGQFPVTRWPHGDCLERGNWRLAYARYVNYPKPLEIFRTYDFMDAAVRWARELKLDIALIDIPFQETECHQARELYLQLSAYGIKTGAIKHDISEPMNALLKSAYQEHDHDWVQAGNYVHDFFYTKLKSQHNRLQVLHTIDSPLFFKPDFVIANSHWTNKFIDLDNSSQTYVLHPLVDFNHRQERPADQQVVLPRDILMINPRRRKNPNAMMELINHAPTTWSFRVLAGGWSDKNAFPEDFLKGIENSLAMQEHRVSLDLYVREIQAAYQAARLLFFPSTSEGYGMTAVEPMYFGVPVVSSDYPAILEAVGDSAKTLCPYQASSRDWQMAVTEVLRNYQQWSQKSLEHSQKLEVRQQQELNSLVDFLQAILEA